MKKYVPPKTMSLSQILAEVLRSFHVSQDLKERMTLRALAKRIDKKSVQGIRSNPIPKIYVYPKKKRRGKKSAWFIQHIENNGGQYDGKHIPITRNKCQ